MTHAPFLTGLAAAAAAGRAAAADVPTVKALSVPNDATKGVLYARKAELFEKHGLHVDLSAMNSGAAVFAALVGNAAQFGSGSLFPVFSAFARGVPLRVVAPIQLYTAANADTWIIVRNESSVHDARGLNGKLLGVTSLNDTDEYSSRGWVTMKGGDGKSIKAVELPAAQMAAALDTGRIDAAIFRPPFLTVAELSGKYRVIGRPYDAIAPRFLQACWVASADFIEKNPGLVRDFVAALGDSARYVNKHQAETIPLVAEFSGADPVLIGKGVRSHLTDSITLADVERPLDFAVANGLIKNKFNVRDLLASSVVLTGKAE
jgi:NitT/TauT family transport system substrate-binding protein